MKKILSLVILIFYTVNFSMVNCLAYETTDNIDKVIFSNVNHYGPSKLNKDQIEFLSKIEKPNAPEYKKKYITKSGNKLYYGLPKINVNKPITNDLYVFDRTYFEYIFIAELYLFTVDEHELNSGQNECLWKSTGGLRVNTNIMEKAIKENQFDNYCKYPYMPLAKAKKKYKLVKKLSQLPDKFSFDERENMFFKSKYIVSINGIYYNNLYKADDEILKQADKIDFYGKNMYKSIKNIEKYKKYQELHNLDNKTMKKVWIDSHRLKKDVALIEKAIKDNSYQDYHKYHECSFGSDFLEDYNSYILLTNSNTFNDEQIKEIVSEEPREVIKFTPKYMGKKDKKIKKVLENTDIEDKYNEIKELTKYEAVSYGKIPLKALSDAAEVTYWSIYFLTVLPVQTIYHLFMYDSVEGIFY